MPDLVGWVAKKYLGDHVVDRFAAEDPYYESVSGPDGKQKKRIKRQLPQGLTRNDEKVLKGCRRRAWCLDLLFSLCGFRAGWTVIIGIIPILGDIINLYLGMALIRHAEKIDGGLPASLRSKMMLNVMIDFGLGFTPILGDIAGAIYKSNSRNYLLLEHLVRDRMAKGTYNRDNHPIVAGNGNGNGRSGKQATRPDTSSGVRTEPVSEMDIIEPGHAPPGTFPHAVQDQPRKQGRQETGTY
uniref:ARAD1B10252p n=1 Tax=Blastobotrys adeninivorans TaxID=409370 RepID=A0A060TAV1_BLAAD